MFVIPRYDWPVDRGPTHARYTSLGDVERGIHISMVLITTVPAAEHMPIAISLVGMSAPTTFLATVPRVHKDNLLSQGLSLICQELFELIEGPSVELSIEDPTTPLLHSYALQILQGEHGVGRTDYLLGDAMVDVGHKPFLSSAQSLEFALCGASAFCLEPTTEILISRPNIFYLFGIEERVIGTDGNINDAPVDAEDIALNWLWYILIDSDMEEESAIFVGEGGRLDLPVEISLIVLWQGERGSDSITESRHANFLSTHPDVHHSPVVADGRVEPKFRKFLELDCSKGLACHIPRTGSKACREPESFSHFIIGRIMDDTLAPSVIPIAPLGTVVSSEIELLDSSDKHILIIRLDRKFELDSPLHSHILTTIPKKPFDSTVKVLCSPPLAKARGFRAEVIS